MKFEYEIENGNDHDMSHVHGTEVFGGIGALAMSAEDILTPELSSEAQSILRLTKQGLDTTTTMFKELEPGLGLPQIMDLTEAGLDYEVLAREYAILGEKVAHPMIVIAPILEEHGWKSIHQNAFKTELVSGLGPLHAADLGKELRFMSPVTVFTEKVNHKSSYGSTVWTVRLIDGSPQIEPGAESTIALPRGSNPTPSEYMTMQLLAHQEGTHYDEWAQVLLAVNSVSEILGTWDPINNRVIMDTFSIASAPVAGGKYRRKTVSYLGKRT